MHKQTFSCWKLWRFCWDPGLGSNVEGLGLSVLVFVGSGSRSVVAVKFLLFPTVGFGCLELGTCPLEDLGFRVYRV